MKTLKDRLKKIKSVKINEKVYKLLWKKPRPQKDEKGEITEISGLCDSPESKNKTIQIDPNLKGSELAIIICHEMLHAGVFCLDEPTVEAVSEDIINFLYKVGFKIEE